MNAEGITTIPPSPPINPWSGSGRLPRSINRPALCRERAWRQPWSGDECVSEVGSIIASRWTDERQTARVEVGPVSAERYIIGVALRPAQLRLRRGTEPTYEGTMPTGMVYVTEPGQAVEAEFFTPCDFVHFHVEADHLRSHQAATAAELQPGDGAEAAAGGKLRNLLFRDELAAQLSRTLTEDTGGGHPLYAETIGQTVLMRVLALRPSAPRVGTLPKWRLRRVQEHLAANFAEPTSLAELAEAAGLSRMHFAAQFRAATGCRPHE